MYFLQALTGADFCCRMLQELPGSWPAACDRLESLDQLAICPCLLEWSTDRIEGTITRGDNY